MKLDDIADIISGGTPATNIKEYWNGMIPWITPKDLSGFKQKYIYQGERKISEEGLNNSSAKLLPKNTILFSSRAPIGYVAIAANELCTNQGFKNFICYESKIYYEYLYYWLKFNKSYIEGYASGSTFSEISASKIGEIEIKLPSVEKQKKIANILSSIDSKIELNNKINDNLYDIGLNIYLKNYKNNENCSFKKLGDFFPVVTGKKDANASSKNGIYPFFTCSQNPLKIDNYSFDDYAILLAGNGDFNVKFYSGKFDAYQRTYVLIPKNKKKTGFLYYSIKYNLNDLTSGHRGSVIKFITKGNIENYLVPYIENNEIESILNLLLENIEKNNKENMVLEKLRDTLLPKLMNGEIDLENIEI